MPILDRVNELEGEAELADQDPRAAARGERRDYVDFSDGDLVQIVKNDQYGSSKCDEWPGACIGFPAIVENDGSHQCPFKEKPGQIRVRVLHDDGRTFTLGWIILHRCKEI